LKGIAIVFDILIDEFHGGGHPSSIWSLMIKAVRNKSDPYQFVLQKHLPSVRLQYNELLD